MRVASFTLSTSAFDAISPQANKPPAKFKAKKTIYFIKNVHEKLTNDSIKKVCKV